MIIGCIMKEETDGEEPAETAWTRLGAEDLPSVGEGDTARIRRSSCEIEPHRVQWTSHTSQSLMISATWQRPHKDLLQTLSCWDSEDLGAVSTVGDVLPPTSLWHRVSG